MSFPGFLIPYIIAATLGGMVALVAKAGVYCLFQRPLGIMKVIVLTIVIHLLSSAAGIGVGVMFLPGHGSGWRTFVAIYLLYAAALSTGCEVLCLCLVRSKLGLSRVGVSAIAANTVYYLILAIGCVVFGGIKALTRVE